MIRLQFRALFTGRKNRTNGISLGALSCPHVPQALGSSGFYGYAVDGDVEGLRDATAHLIDVGTDLRLLQDERCVDVPDLVAGVGNGLPDDAEHLEAVGATPPLVGIGEQG